MRKILSILVIIASLSAFSACNHEHEFPGADDAARPTFNKRLNLTYEDAIFSPTDLPQDALPDWLYKTYKTSDVGAKAHVLYQIKDSEGTIAWEKGEYEFKGHTNKWVFVAIIPNFILFEDFESFAKYAEIELEGWINHTVKHAADQQFLKPWQANIYTTTNNKYAEATPYKTGDNIIESWLILPAVKIEEIGLLFSFKYQYIYKNNEVDPMTFLVSTNFNGKKTGIETATWTNIRSEVGVVFPAEGSTSNGSLLPSIPYNLDKYNGKTVYFAFRFLSHTNPAPKATTNFQVDDVRVGY